MRMVTHDPPLKLVCISDNHLNFTKGKVYYISESMDGIPRVFVIDDYGAGFWQNKNIFVDLVEHRNNILNELLE